MVARVHIIDSDVRRRAQVARQFFSQGIHAEIYDGMEEFIEASPEKGLLFAADEVLEKGPKEFIESLVSSGISQPLVVYAELITPEKVVDAIQNGAFDYLQWPFDATQLDRTFRKLWTDGERLVRQARRRAAAKTLLQRLSARERQVLVGVANGKSNKGIAADLDISPRTVEIHRGNMMSKLNAQSTSDAVRVAIYAGLDATDDLSDLSEVA